MTTDPDQIRARIAELLADLPDPFATDDIAPTDVAATDVAATDIDAVALRLEQAHDLLVHALESVEKG